MALHLVQEMVSKDIVPNETTSRIIFNMSISKSKNIIKEVHVSADATRSLKNVLEAENHISMVTEVKVFLLSHSTDA